MTEELRQALRELEGRPMSVAEFEAQRQSFVYGNAPAEDKGTKEDVKRALTEPDYVPA